MGNLWQFHFMSEYHVLQKFPDAFVLDSPESKDQIKLQFHSDGYYL